MKNKIHTYKDGEYITLGQHCAADLFKTPVRQFTTKWGIGQTETIIFDLVKELNIPTDSHCNRARNARRKAGKIFEDFMSMLAHDMIEDHVIFILPMPGGGYLYITDLNAIQRPDRKIYPVNTKGVYYVPILHRGMRLNRRRIALYTIRFNQKWRNVLLKKALAGERYID